MSSFDFMNFTGGINIEFVAHAKKFTKEQAIAKCLYENDHKFNRHVRTPLVDDIKEAYVKYYVKCPEWCGFDTDSGCYTYCGKDVRGSFPVWVIDFGELRFIE